MRPARTFALFLCLALAALPASASALTRTSLVFGGGPVGGTYNVFASAMAIELSKGVPGLEVDVKGTGGSGANLLGLDAGRITSYNVCYTKLLRPGGIRAS